MLINNSRTQGVGEGALSKTVKAILSAKSFDKMGLYFLACKWVIFKTENFSPCVYPHSPKFYTFTSEHCKVLAYFKSF